MEQTFTSGIVGWFLYDGGCERSVVISTMVIVLCGFLLASRKTRSTKLRNAILGGADDRLRKYRLRKYLRWEDRIIFGLVVLGLVLGAWIDEPICNCLRQQL